MKIPHYLDGLLLILFVLLIACTGTEKEIEVTSIAISQPSAEMEIGETLTLKATVSPSKSSYDDFTWTSTKPRVASVSNTGLVTAIAEGNTTITVMAGGKTASCSITVIKGIVAVSSISLNKKNLELVEGDTETLWATVFPEDATDKTVSWISSDDGVATVKDGVITAIKEGETTITAIAGEQTASCIVKVQKKVITVESIKLSRLALTLFEGESETLVATVFPEDATDKSVSWESSNTSIVTIDDNGTVRAVKVGEATITARSGDVSCDCFVSVSHDGNRIITFSDKLIKERLVVAFDTNDDGELSYKEVAAVHSGLELKTALDGANDYKSFDEFQYFTSIASIPSEMFKNWTQLTTISLPRSLSSISDFAFYYCISLSNINIPDSITSIGGFAFNLCFSLSSIILPNRVISIGYRAFYICGLTSITIPDSVTDIESAAFTSCNSLYSFEGKFASSDGLFLICKGHLIAAALAAIEGSISIPNSVSSIGLWAFSSCKNLTRITIPESVTCIEMQAFQNCTNLTSVIIQSKTPPIIQGGVFQDTNECPIYVPSGSVEAYKTSDYWIDYADRIQAIPE